MKKTLTRIAACLMVCVFAFNIYAVPRAKAVVTETTVVAFAPAVLAMYMKAAGVNMAATSVAAGSAAAAQMIGGYAAATGTTASAVTSSIATGAVISTSGAIILGVAAVALLAAITAWAINEYKLSQEGGALVYDLPTGWFDPDIPQFEHNWSSDKIYFRDIDNTIYCYMFSDQNDPHFCTYLYFAEDGFLTVPVGRTDMYYFASLAPNSTIWGRLSSIYQARPGHTFGSMSRFLYSTFDIYDYNGNLVYAADQQVTAEVNSNVEPIPELLTTQQMVFEVAAGSGATQESFANHVFTGLTNNTLNPTYKIEEVGVSTNPDGGEVETPDASLSVGLLQRIAIAVEAWANKIGVHGGFLERITNACESLGGKIVGGFESIFVPDAALTTEITDTFSEKFAFVPQLHALGVDLLNLKPDSEPPVIWIHLEDTEGSINYGGTVKALDMSWYERYKEDGDRIIGGFLWLGFLWALFMRVSDIINGAGMAYVLGQPTIYTPEPPNDAPRLEGSRKRGKR